ncbi:hypothetical protein COV23_01180 [Candidatus Wolfebacteria bacterium CG10_big_fil_rev_8_21_14_0_10_31_9]|uniref:Uncharacterized protein n=1 Tax=Candidatus Wolfebacteria bacterium CG10_big_fil_rev_8_21_14_0_10_31_9 TaxID=1975070 RepID=A0A2H0RCV5_9BACT|nr:MAG: hypothetical protein COV23_01180 [Candidatus Wolfebacteria bacterium CG10_big_fil_rev_8_21_14_0_10_31_9]
MIQVSRLRIKENGQSLIEIVIALAIGVLLIGGVTTLIGVNLRSSYDTKTVQTASSFAQEIIDQTKSVAESDWHKIYNLTKGSGQRYYISTTTPNIVISNGTELVTSDGKNFSRYFYVENSNRTKCGIGDITSNATTSCDDNFSLAGANDRADDPLTQKITAVVLLNNNEVVRQIQYLIRSGNAVLIQTDWSGGDGQVGPITTVNNKFETLTNIDAASIPGAIKLNLPGGGGGGGNIDPILGYAFNDIIEWIDFRTPGNIMVYNDRLEGYASSSVGYIALNCNSTPIEDICASSDFKVSNDGNGNLTGWAWNDGIGWISFDSASAGSLYPYQVIIDTGTGEFSGWAWNDNIGWISFNCINTSSCGAVSYKVKTDWVNYGITGSLISSIFDTGSIDGVTLNSVIWHGTQPSETNVKFQIASSNNPTGPWSYFGPSGSSVDYYIGSASSSIPLNLRNHNNVRYFRYKIFLDSDSSKTLTPQVNDVIINYSI